MKFVPVVNCPGCNMPYTSAQLGFPFTTGARYTVICGIKDNKDRKVGCGCAFDFEVVEVPDTEVFEKKVQKPGFFNRILGKHETVRESVQIGTHLEVRAKVRGT